MRGRFGKGGPLKAIGYDARLRAIDLDLQQQFVDRHWADLEAWALHVAG